MIETTFFFYRLNSEGLKIAKVKISDLFWEFLKAYTYTTNPWPTSIMARQRAYKLLMVLPPEVKHTELNCTDEELLAEKAKLKYLKSYLGASILLYFNNITQILLRVTENGEEVQALTERRAEDWRERAYFQSPTLKLTLV